MGALIERLHNVAQRGEPPQKRQKSDKLASEERKRAFGSGGKGGEIGDYMKQERNKGQIVSGPTNVVDLTGSNLPIQCSYRMSIYPLS